MNSVLLLIAQRLAYSLGTLALVSVIIFAAVEVLPGDIPSRILGREAPAAARELKVSPKAGQRLEVGRRVGRHEAARLHVKAIDALAVDQVVDEGKGLVAALVQGLGALTPRAGPKW